MDRETLRALGQISVQNVMSYLQTSWQNGDSDAVFRCGGGIYSNSSGFDVAAHQLVLAALSPMLRIALESRPCQWEPAVIIAPGKDSKLA